MTGAHHATGDGAESSGELTRRGVLRTASVAVVGGAVAGGTATAAGARQAEIRELDFRDGVPPVADAPQGRDEVVFHVHGYSESGESVAAADEFLTTARDLGFDGTVAAVTWDDGRGAISNARETGDRLASWLADFRAANPGTTIRLLGYSMGGIVVTETMRAADGAVTVANADMIGSYEQADAPCRGSGFYDGIAASCVGMYNYWSGNDGIARLGSEGGAACGASETPPNYTDVDVTASVGSHLAYRRSRGCVRKILDNFESGDGGGGGGELAVQTGEATAVGADRATLSGRLTALGGADAAEVALEYRPVGADAWTATATQTLGETGAYDATVTGLAAATEYEFRAVATAGDASDAGASATFVTGSEGGDVAPTVESADVEADCYWRCYVDTTWTVADADGDLATVESVLVGTEGEEIDAAATDVSGADASGTHDLRSGWFDDPDRVLLRVTDGAGNVTERALGG